MKSVSVVGTGGPVRLLFRESNPSDGSGPYIDGVVLAKRMPTPAPTPAPTAAATPAPTPSPTVPECVTSDANLVCNGSFESNDVPDGGDEAFDDDLVPGWKSLTNSVCLVDNRGGVEAPDGFNYAELDCIAGGPTEGLFQDIPTEAGQIYDLTFMMRARDPAKANTEDEGINVSLCLFRIAFSPQYVLFCGPPMVLLSISYSLQRT